MLLAAWVLRAARSCLLLATWVLRAARILCGSAAWVLSTALALWSAAWLRGVTRLLVAALMIRSGGWGYIRLALRPPPANAGVTLASAGTRPAPAITPADNPATMAAFLIDRIEFSLHES